MRFWSAGTCSAGISTPRSPRATITASVTARISSSALDRRRLLQLGDHRNIFLLPQDQPLDRQKILGSPDHGEGDKVDPMRKTEFEIGAVLCGERGKAQIPARHIDSLVSLKRSPADNTADDLFILDPEDAKLDRAVVHHDGIARPDLFV
ncbi:MAG: hypothetical protein MPW14_21390 [Candidatus Manganitrophus sp.]|nr:MAG: hypothetical protein MPW14_21390 [Candidatus Manganitrophus sp.]